MSDETTREASRTRITVNVELAQLSPNVHFFRFTLKQLILDCSHQTGTCEIELDGEVRSIHFDRLAVRFVANALVPATERGRIARCGEEVQISGRRRGKIHESAKTRSLIEAPGYNWNIHTLGSPCHSKYRALLETVIRLRCKEGAGRERELV